MSSNNNRVLIIFFILILTMTSGLPSCVPLKTGISKIPQPASQHTDNSTYSYKDNPKYAEKISHFFVYRKQADIVMLGNSITARADWSELLDRNDIVNRGIDSDVTEGYLNRMESIYSVCPKICFIMGGVNDIARKIPLESTVRNIVQICTHLKEHQIIPVMQSVLYVADSYPEYETMNASIHRTNLELERVAKVNGIRYVDLNRYLSSEKVLKKEFVLFDGIHLNGAGYAKWGTILSGILADYGL
jgi:lysophospholipase L1-like esterase